MNLKFAIGAAACAFTLAGTSLTANAGIGSTANELGVAAREQSCLDPVAYRNCWWRHGVRHCRYYRGGRSYGYTGPHLPEAYPTGSTRWWQEMDRQDRGGRGRR